MIQLKIETEIMRNPRPLSYFLIFCTTFFLLVTGCSNDDSQGVGNIKTEEGRQSFFLKRLKSQEFSIETEGPISITKGFDTPDFRAPTVPSLSYLLIFDENLDFVELDIAVHTIERCLIDSNQLLLSLSFPHRDIDSLKIGFAHSLLDIRDVSTEEAKWLYPHIYFMVNDFTKLDELFIKLILRFNKGSKQWLEMEKIDPESVYCFRESYTVIDFSDNGKISPCDDIDLIFFKKTESSRIFQLTPNGGLPIMSN